MLVCTDASYCANTKIAGWACVISYRGAEKSFSGSFKPGVAACGTEAEFLAIKMAIGLGLNMYDICKINHVVVVTDSSSAKNLINETCKRKLRVKRLWDIVDDIKNLLPDGCEIEARKVKAHTQKTDKKSVNNQHVDKNAKRVMRRKRDEMKGKCYDEASGQ